MSTHYDELADWAEHEVQLTRDSTTARRGGAAASSGRALLARAGRGRPPLSGTQGEHSPKRQVRLPAGLSRRVDEIAHEQDRTPAEVMREAIAGYVLAHDDHAAAG